MFRLAIASLIVGLALSGAAVGATGVLDGHRIRAGSISERALGKAVRAKLNAKTPAPAQAGKQGERGPSGASYGCDAQPFVGQTCLGAPSTVPGPAGRDGVTTTVHTTESLIQIPSMDAVPHCNPTDQNSQEGLKFTVPNQNPLYLCNGVPGLPGPAPTQQMVDGAINDYCRYLDTSNHCKGATGDTGPAGPQGIRGDTGDTGPQGPQGEPGTDGFTASVPTVVSTSGTVSTTEPNEVSADCGQGVPIGGGYKINTGAQVARITASYPGAHSWNVAAMSANGTFVDVTVWAMCVAAP